MSCRFCSELICPYCNKKILGVELLAEQVFYGGVWYKHLFHKSCRSMCLDLRNFETLDVCEGIS